MGSDLFIGTPEWAWFEDWLAVLGISEDWTALALIHDYPDTSLPFFERFAFSSYLVQSDETIVEEILESDNWEVNHGQASIPLEKFDQGIAHQFESGYIAKSIIRLIDEIGPHPAHWKLWPTLLRFYNLRSDTYGNLINPYTNETVVKFPETAYSGPVIIRTDYLDHYLKKRDMVLICQHDNDRFWTDQIDGLGEMEAGRILKKGWGSYRLDLTNSNSKGSNNISRITAKEIIRPVERILTEELFPHFIATTLNGKRLEIKPNRLLPPRRQVVTIYHFGT